MPELIADGPNIPIDLLNQLDDGKVVFFCGAGISYGTGLPGFRGLVDHVYTKTGRTRDALEQQLWLMDPSPLDKILGLLEDPERLPPLRMREVVIERLSEKPTGPLDLHKALLDLARTGDRDSVRLVTTNFDDRFLLAGYAEKLTDSAPKLPVPKPNGWSTLVHLHGRISADGLPHDLVLTAADFGRAYLTERWASRFVTELFRDFTIVFVGYSLGDPVMAYMVDALAAERAKGNRFGEAYAFAGYSDTAPTKEHPRKDESERAWRAKSVRPILYDVKTGHRLLNETIIEWARIRHDPFKARSQIAINEIDKLPGGASDPTVQRVCWALENGEAAKALADSKRIEKDTEFDKLRDWVIAFDEAGLLSVGEPRQDKQHRPISPIVAVTRIAHILPLSRPTWQLCRWLSRHLHVPQILEWIVRKGGCLHPEFADLIQRQLARPEFPIPDRLRLLWTLLLQTHDLDPDRRLWMREHLRSSTAPEERSAIERFFVKSLRPKLLVRPGPPSKLAYDDILNEEKKGIAPIDRAAHLALRLGKDDFPRGLDDIGVSVEALGRHATEIAEYLEQAAALLPLDEEGFTYPQFYRPSIAPHEQNTNRDEWTLLIDLALASFAELLKSDAAKSDALLQRWVSSDYPLLWRVALHVISTNIKLKPSLALKILYRSKRPGLWDLELYREVMVFLRSIGHRLTTAQLQQLVAKIRKGPGKKAEMSAKRADYEIAKRLYKLSLSDIGLDEATMAVVATYTPPDPEEGADRDEFLSWSGPVRWISPIDEMRPQLREMTVEQIIEEISQDKVREDEFEGFAILRLHDAMTALERVGQADKWPQPLWTRLFWAVSTLRRQEKLSPETEAEVGGLLLLIPTPTLTEIGSSPCDFIEHLANTYPKEREDFIRPLWLKAWAALPENPEIPETNDILNWALNSAAGRLAEAANHRLWKYKPTAESGIPAELREYFDHIGGDAKGHLARVMLVARLHNFFVIDRAWTERHILPRMQNVDTLEAKQLWGGYAWSPKVGPTLLATFKDAFLHIVSNYEAAYHREGNLISLFLSVCLDAPHELTRQEIKGVLESLPVEGLVEAIHRLAHRLEGPDEQRAKLWREKLAQWIPVHWPLAGASNNAETSKAFAHLITEAGDAYPDAVTTLLPYLRPIPSGLYEIESAEQSFPDRFPDATFALLRAIISQDVLQGYEHQYLMSILDRVGNANGELVANPEFQRLRRIATG